MLQREDLTILQTSGDVILQRFFCFYIDRIRMIPIDHEIELIPPSYQASLNVWLAKGYRNRPSMAWPFGERGGLSLPTLATVAAYH